MFMLLLDKSYVNTQARSTPRRMGRLFSPIVEPSPQVMPFVTAAS